jgi:O-methyltransferase
MPILLEISKRKGDGKNIFLEAGCWLGGSSIKFSLLCDVFNYPLHIFDSFEGVEVGNESSEEKHFSGTYIGPIEQVKSNIKRFGCIDVCIFHKGWFHDTMKTLKNPVRICYIDCDLSKGTKEVLSAVVPNLSCDGTIYSQDYYIRSIREMLHQNEIWEELDLSMPNINHVARNLAKLKFT